MDCRPLAWRQDHAGCEPTFLLSTALALWQEAESGLREGSPSPDESPTLGVNLAFLMFLELHPFVSTSKLVSATAGAAASPCCRLLQRACVATSLGPSCPWPCTVCSAPSSEGCRRLRKDCLCVLALPTWCSIPSLQVEARCRRLVRESWPWALVSLCLMGSQHSCVLYCWPGQVWASLREVPSARTGRDGRCALVRMTRGSFGPALRCQWLRPETWVSFPKLCQKKGLSSVHLGLLHKESARVPAQGSCMVTFASF